MGGQEIPQRSFVCVGVMSFGLMDSWEKERKSPRRAVSHSHPGTAVWRGREGGGFKANFLIFSL